MKRVFKWLGVVGAVLVILAGAGWYYAFGNNLPIVEGTIAPGVQEVKDGFANIFILDAGLGKVALVDAGHDESGKALLAALAQRSLPTSAVAAVFLTHGHPDHTAGCRLVPDARIYAMEADVALIGSAAKVSQPLKDGDVVTVGDLRVEAFAVPGHTPGSAVYLARGVLFFGDSAGASKDHQVMKAVGLFSKDSGENVTSLKTLTLRLAPRKTDVQELAFGHTGPLPGFDPLAAFAARN